MKKSSLMIEGLSSQPSSQDFLYRYVTIDKLLDFILNSRIPLTRLSLFDDNLEGTTPKHLLLDLASEKIAKEYAEWMGGLFQHITTNFNPTERNSLHDQRQLFQENNYANCWFVSNHESIAMWQLYSRPDSVAIRIKHEDLLSELRNNRFTLSYSKNEKLRYGSVSYYRFDDLDEISDLIIKEDVQGFVKDYGFEHEKEFRVILSIQPEKISKAKNKEFILRHQIKDANELRDRKIIYLIFNEFNDVPFEIIFHPQSSPWHKKNIQDIISKYEINIETESSKLGKIFGR